jgi:dihydrofolate synthase/folylpolyglutamate synthase
MASPEKDVSNSLNARYAETLAFMFRQLPMYQMVGASAYKKDLHNTLALLDFLGNPHQGLTCIHVGGTNGKGSTSHLLSAILQAKGLKTGLFVSPHYRDFRERIKCNGQLVGKRFVVEFIERVRPVIETIQPSFFELTTAMAFDYFARRKVDAAVIEVGLGGRLDSTNVISPVLSVITNISYDHTNILGNTLSLIAAEKAGIIKTDTPVVIGETHPETAGLFLEKAAQQHAPLVFADQHYHAEIRRSDFRHSTFDVYREGVLYYENLVANLSGAYQRFNLQTVLQAVECLPQALRPDEQAIRDGLANLKKRTAFIGRWDLIQETPRVLLDSAHNEGGLKEALKEVQRIPCQTLHIVFGASREKDIEHILDMLPRHARYYFAKASIPRALDAEDLAVRATAHGLKGRSYSSVKNALRAAKRRAGADDLIFVGGSIFIVAEVI